MKNTNITVSIEQSTGNITVATESIEDGYEIIQEIKGTQSLQSWIEKENGLLPDPYPDVSIGTKAHAEFLALYLTQFVEKIEDVIPTKIQVV
jgi:hypothetical protein